MKHSVSRLLAILLSLALFAGTAAASRASAEETPSVISLRIEGINENLYHNSAMATTLSGRFTLRDVLNSLGNHQDVPQITIINEKENSRITQIGSLKEKCFGSPYNDGWMIRVNGKDAGRAPDMVGIESGDEIVLFYADASLIQYPEIDLTRMITDGIVKITSSRETADDMGNTDIVKKPVAGATVTWDGMKYTTDSNGEIIIDSTGAGVRHTVQIELYHESGLPTVLRQAPGFYVKYGFDDVLEGEWYYDSVMFAAEKYLINGVSDTGFAPEMPMNRAMFVTVIGRLMNADVDQTEETGFPDVKNDGWSTGYIAWAAKNGIVTGRPDGTFGQYVGISREQTAVLLFKYAFNMGYDTGLAYKDLSAYTDFGSVSGYAETAVRWAVENGIMSGSYGRLDPQGVVTRAQAAALLERFVSKFVNSC
jgi:hypothetical protein